MVHFWTSFVWTLFGIVYCAFLSFVVYVLPVTLPGTNAWRLAITWGKPVFCTVWGRPSSSVRSCGSVPIRSLSYISPRWLYNPLGYSLVGQPIRGVLAWLGFFWGHPSLWSPIFRVTHLWGHPSSWSPIFGVTHPVFARVWAFLFFCFSRLFFDFWYIMPVQQPKTVVIHAHGMVAAKSSNVMVQMLSKKLDFSKVKTIQFIPGGRIRVTFTSLEYRNTILNRKTLQIDDVHFLNITASDDPVTTVYVHYLPDEAGDVGIRLALQPFGTVHGISYQHFAGFNNISTGTKIVRMSLNQHIPFQCNIQGYPCRVWYVGQPLRCTICNGAHKAADCPDRNKCKRCKQPGHFAKDCKNTWGTSAQTPAPIPAPLPGLNPPAPAPSVPSPVTPSASDPPEVPSVVIAAKPVPPPLMSVTVQPPEQSQVDGLAPSQVSLFSESEDSIADFSEEDPSPAPPPSPTISSFPSDNDSQSILKGVTIVSGDPMEAQQTGCNPSDVNSNVTGPMASNVAKSNVTGPKGTQGKSNSKVMGPKVAQSKDNGKDTGNVTGPKAALSKSNSNAQGPKVAHSNNSNSQSDLSNSQISLDSQIQLPDSLVDSDSSSSEAVFKTPHPPRPRRTLSQSPSRSRSRSPLVPDSPGAHRGMPQVPKDRPSRCS